MKTKTRTIYRDSETGRLIPKEQAERNPRTTEKERVKVPPRPTKK